jgi:hypothetical protein
MRRIPYAADHATRPHFHHFTVGAAESRLLAFEKAVKTKGLTPSASAFLVPTEH